MAAVLTREQAVSLQDELISEFSKSGFQSKLHKVWKDTTLGPMEQAQARQEVCFAVQGPIIAKYGFEASRQGLSQSIKAFTPELKADPEISSKSEYLRWLVDPSMQAKKQIKPYKPPKKGGGYRGPVQPVTKEKEAIVPRPKLTHEQALDLETELIAKFSRGEFQRKVHQAWHAGGRSAAAKARGAYDVALGFLCATVPRYGFASSPEGVTQCLDVLSHDLVADCDVGLKLALIKWLSEPGLQMSVHAPTGTAKTEFHVWHKDGSLCCCVSGEATSTVRDVKNLIKAETGILPYAQRLLVGETELHDMDMLCGCVPGGVVEAVLVSRPPEIATWLQRIEKDPEVDWYRRKVVKTDCLAEAPPELLANREFLFPAVLQDAKVLEYVTPELRADRELMLAAVRQTGNALRFAPPELRADRDVVHTAIMQDGWAMSYVDPTLKADVDLALLTILQDACTIDLIDVALRGRKDIAMSAVSRTGGVLQVLGPELQADREVVLAAVREDGEALAYAALQLQADRGIVVAACRRNSDSLRFAHSSFQSDRDIVLAAVSCNGSALRWASDELQKDREIVRAAVRNSAIALSIVAQDAEIVNIAIRNNPRALLYVEDRFMKVAYASLAGRATDEYEDIHYGDGKVFSLRWPPSGDMLEHFEALQLVDSVKPPTVAEIRASYRKLALEHHPDKHPDDAQAATVKFQSISDAYSSIMQLLA